jgi:hypothetical protein
MNDNIKAGGEIHAGDGGYSIGTQEKYDEFVKIRNQSLVKARLREFERASGLEIYGLGAKRVKWEAAMEKFAELIVQECAQVAVFKDSGTVATADVAGHMAAGRSIAARLIQEHFGVEE